MIQCQLLGCCRSIQIALVLLRELKMGPELLWRVWIQSLPQHFNTLMHWSPEELAQLQLNSSRTEQDFLFQVSKTYAIYMVLFYEFSKEIQIPSLWSMEIPLAGSAAFNIAISLLNACTVYSLHIMRQADCSRTAGQIPS